VTIRTASVDCRSLAQAFKQKKSIDLAIDAEKCGNHCAVTPLFHDPMHDGDGESRETTEDCGESMHSIRNLVFRVAIAIHNRLVT
jgi:hypothetical protein